MFADSMRAFAPFPGQELRIESANIDDEHQ
jgi:hypothetical protein